MSNRVTIHLTNDTKDTDHRDPKNSLKRVFRDATVKLGNGFLEVSWTEAGCIVSRGWPASGISFFEQEYR